MGAQIVAVKRLVMGAAGAVSQTLRDGDTVYVGGQFGNALATPQKRLFAGFPPERAEARSAAKLVVVNQAHLGGHSQRWANLPICGGDSMRAGRGRLACGAAGNPKPDQRLSRKSPPPTRAAPPTA